MISIRFLPALLSVFAVFGPSFSVHANIRAVGSTYHAHRNMQEEEELTGQLQTRIRNLEAALETLLTETLPTLESDIQDQITSNDNDITNLFATTADLQAQIISNDNDISVLLASTSENQGGLTELIGTVIPGLKTELETQIQSNDADINAIRSDAIQMGNDINAAFINIKGIYNAVFETLRVEINKVLNVIVDFFNAAITGTISFLNDTVFPAISFLVESALNGIIAVINISIGVINTAVETAVDAPIGLLNNVIGNINNVLDFTIPLPGALPDITIDLPNIPGVSGVDVPDIPTVTKPNIGSLSVTIPAPGTIANFEILTLALPVDTTNLITVPDFLP